MTREKKLETVKAKLLPGRVPERGVQFCRFCRTGERVKGDPLWCSCNNQRCPFAVGEAST